MVFVHGGSFAADSAIKYGDLGICRNLVNYLKLMKNFKGGGK